MVVVVVVVVGDGGGVDCGDGRRQHGSHPTKREW